MKTIVHVVQHLRPGGIEVMVLDMLRFADKANKVFVVSLEGSKDKALQSWPRLKDHEHQLFFLDKTPGIELGLFMKMKNLLSSLKADVVHSHHIGPLLYGNVTARFANVPVRIHTEHDAWHLNEDSEVRIEKLARYLSKPKMVADAEFVKDKLVRIFDDIPVETIHNGVDCDHFTPGAASIAREKLGLPNNKRIIGCSGRVEHVKGQDTLIHALKDMPCNVILAIAGDGSEKESLMALAEELKLEDRVLFLGFVSDMVNFYRSLDLYCLPSRNEGFPLSTLEAQACDIPVVATDVGGVKESLCLKSGQLVLPDNAPLMSEILVSMLNCPSPFSPRSYVVENYDIRNMTSAYEKLCDQGE
ncbi:putative Glycosyltransferase SypP [Vibrio nigripulchritudo SFn27]|uniref:Putative Glycosyltransferase SypP n=1 Tax=Vibrio nigripulchritudo TaxID=28173 RepID=U4KF32_9VIBR|nr:glycosyltransferase [Vibrio nigripulchritudo]CCN85211.1 putative Glycosyltransferase SypP [Vibrio nigripulchritudo BLFn1]CCN87639.1 putative Glycosyltransferase SypP [Vibrio nigripulchritudo SFn27]CCN92520.1 putative Glycosyltransferase SypP [Vibrio nigripulchritudo ENn2]CCO39383.1 putative Glycosyltransferase SypP [Vibrio nigripulchritudo SFn135]CCO53389.1 putative Glycosyltransferase SypP [Vibrio nigripulchritudo Wn13]